MPHKLCIPRLLTFWYVSVDLEPFFAFGSSTPSIIIEASIASAIASFSTSRRGFAPIFFGACAFFGLFALGGVLERSESSCNEGSPSESSSSVSGLGRFFVGLSVVCDNFFGGPAFFGAALGFGLAFGLAAALGFALAFYMPNLNQTIVPTAEKFESWVSYRCRRKIIGNITIIEHRVRHERIHLGRALTRGPRKGVGGFT